MWDGEKSTLGRSMRTTFEAINAFGPARAAEDHRDTYPGSSLGRSLATAAQIIRGDVGVEVITVDQGNWDMHTDMGSADGGWMSNNAKDLGGLDRRLPRRPRHPGEQGHPGHHQRVRAPGRRERQQRHRPRLRQRHVPRRRRGARWLPRPLARPVSSYESDLTVTTDYRQVLADVVSRRFNASVPAVFPGLKWQSTGVML